MKKRVAIIVPGGIGAGKFKQGVPALANLINGLADIFDITVFSMVEVEVDFDSFNFKIESLKAAHKYSTLGTMFRLLSMVMRVHKRNNFDLFHGIWGSPTGTMAVFLGKRLGRPSLVSLQGGEAAAVKSIGYGHLQRKFKKRWLFLTLHAADHITALTHYQVNELKSHGFKNRSIEVIPYGVDTNHFSASEKQYEEPIQFIHIANLTEVKDQKTLLKAFRIIRNNMDSHLRIIGDDYHNGGIQTYCKALDLQDDVTFTGAIPHAEIPGHLAESHCMLHTSLYEAQAVVVVEAMACKVLVAGTSVGIIADCNEYMISVPIGDYESLAKSVMDVFSKKEQIYDRVENAHKWAHDHDINYTVGEFTAIYKKLMT